MNENVLVVPSSGIAPLLSGSFTTTNLDACQEYILANYSFLSRAVAEDDPSFKQIIPYVLVQHEQRYFMTRRTERQTERRLHGKHSLGIGGHINDLEKSGDSKNVIHAGLERELEEEIELKGNRLSLDLVGIISDDTTPVGRVHLGLVFVLNTDSAECSIRESELMTAEWANVELLRSKFPLMETWSQIVFENIIAPKEALRKGELAAT